MADAPTNPSVILTLDVFGAMSGRSGIALPRARDQGKQIHVESIPFHRNYRDVYADIISRIEQQVKANGTLDTIRLDGHGSSQNIGITGNPILPSLLLNKMEELQDKLGIKLANHIEFLGCSVFTNIGEWDVQRYRKSSQKLGAEIIGTTHYATARNEPLISFKDGAVGRFTEGEWHLKDAVRNAWLRVEDPFFHGYEFSLNWLKCHEGKTQEEGEACQKDSRRFEVASADFAKLVSAPARFVAEALSPSKPSIKR